LIGVSSSLLGVNSTKE